MPTTTTKQTTTTTTVCRNPECRKLFSYEMHSRGQRRMYCSQKCASRVAYLHGRCIEPLAEPSAAVQVHRTHDDWNGEQWAEHFDTSNTRCGGRLRKH